MPLINNKRVKAGELLTTTITKNSDLSVVTALFSIYALELLGNTLSSIDKMRLLFSSPLDIHDAFAFIGDADERGLRNRLTQQHIAKKCKEWLSKQAEIAQTTSSSIVHQNLFWSDKIAIQGSADLTASGLGFVNSIRHDMSASFDDLENIAELKEWFDAIWHDHQHVQDIKKAFLDQLDWLGKDKAPNSIYFLILYHIFSNTLCELDEEKIIKTKTGIKEHLVWKKLYKFQKDGVLGAIDKLEKYNGCIIADSVGLGKTFEALAIIKYYELRNDLVLVLCPRRL